MSADPYLVIVAADDKGQPQIPEVFVTNGQQAVNYHRNTWHATLTTVVADGLFAVVDYIGEAGNLQESPLDPGCLINFESSPG